ncbi:type II toxin-antitoxin system mRNA interferase toxin, RelE/StbE family [Pricia sp. S334]|uniref:Type II toxin-antitoxin system mRNA interferase toxin, RelE/StbE family n=1 Tax=Pricia mediterranea TaxID=3076079 RepID=A0ABU3L5R8_9FLAO|nr:type II toxin-antitoxin system mRNA interferase toxin, RelE/StbE family [Pricia sp. S334]MDT7828593.1 type II toxin-antitoxin system mRNA interferase toxin, RelE/StbE family [Pricia sp. S334]
MYYLDSTTKFKKDLKKIKRNQKDFGLAVDVLKILEEKGVQAISAKRRPHEYKDNWECHIKPDLFIIWFQIESPKIIRLIRIGSHSDLFK